MHDLEEVLAAGRRDALQVVQSPRRLPTSSVCNPPSRTSPARGEAPDAADRLLERDPAEAGTVSGGAVSPRKLAPIDGGTTAGRGDVRLSQSRPTANPSSE